MQGGAFGLGLGFTKQARIHLEKMDRHGVSSMRDPQGRWMVFEMTYGFFYRMILMILQYDPWISSFVFECDIKENDDIVINYPSSIVY